MAGRTELPVPARLGLYGAILVVVFLAAYVIAGAVVPDEFVDRWQHRAHSAPVVIVDSPAPGFAGAGGGEVR